MSVMQELYDSEISARIVTFWDNGFDWYLGDPIRGWKAADNTLTYAEAEASLAAAALEHYPDSDFAKRRKGATA